MKYNYQKLEQITNPDGVRHYTIPSGLKVPSITTILSATSDDSGIQEWKNRIGEQNANFELQKAINNGTLLHKHIECYLQKIPRPFGTNKIYVRTEKMSNVIIEKGLCHVNEIWGVEAPLYSELGFAGTTDLVGVYKNKPAIMDYKNSKKIKEEKYIEDYFLQITGYALAHNELFNTNIETGVIFMVTRTDDPEFKSFEININDYKQKLIDRLIVYYNKLLV